MDLASIRRKLTRWYRRAKRDLPWRRTRDPYAIWVSEIMLQQTRVAAVIPFYERFLKRFPDVAALAAAPEAELLALWSGLGYYSRARNLQKSAREFLTRGGFPKEHDQLLTLAGVGEYTAAAVASIAFGLPYAAVDGNVRRVIARLANNADADADAAAIADRLLDRRDPGRWNQAMMDLGATICLPRGPRCDACPLATECGAHIAGTEADIPRKRKKTDTVRLHHTLLVIRANGKILLTPSRRVQGFWDLPESGEGDVRKTLGPVLGTFSHAITNKRYRFTVREIVCETRGHGSKSNLCEAAPQTEWFDESTLGEIPLGTTARKALRILYNSR